MAMPTTAKPRHPADRHAATRPRMPSSAKKASSGSAKVMVTKAVQ
jgi:hypothetical protein